jgi:hypothetical protein
VTPFDVVGVHAQTGAAEITVSPVLEFRQRNMDVLKPPIIIYMT